jgi:hypothetical protein
LDGRRQFTNLVEKECPSFGLGKTPVPLANGASE